MERQEFITSMTKKIEAYTIGIARLQKEVETELNGQPLRTEGVDGMPVFHTNFTAINRKMNDIAVAIQRQKNCQKELDVVLAEKE
jgi:hypothetical protein